MTPEAKTGKLFNGELWVEAVLDSKSWEHEVQHRSALLSVPAKQSTLVKYNFKMIKAYIRGLERDLYIYVSSTSDFKGKRIRVSDGSKSN